MIKNDLVQNGYLYEGASVSVSKQEKNKALQLGENCFDTVWRMLSSVATMTHNSNAIGFARQNHKYYDAKPMVLEGKTIGFVKR